MKATVFTPPDQGSTRWVKDAESAQILTTPKTLRYFSPFLVSECSASDAAQVLGLEISAVSYWITRFLKLGLLRVARTERRAGRSIRHYHASAETFFVPFSAIPIASLEAMHDRLLSETCAAMTRSQVATLLEHGASPGVRVFPQAKRLRMEYVEGVTLAPLYSLEPSRPAVLEHWEMLKLNFEDAKALQAELSAVLERYMNRAGANQYLVNVRLAPFLRKH
jgi:DNA-binding transcriptional ArsR family regulator